jgi:WXG100 family type VII secretion target
MRPRASQFTTEANNLQSIIQKMDSLNNQLAGEWEGAAQQQFNARWNGDLKKSFNEAKDLIDQVSTALKNTATIIEDTDNKISNQLK